MTDRAGRASLGALGSGRGGDDDRDRRYEPPRQQHHQHQQQQQQRRSLSSSFFFSPFSRSTAPPPPPPPPLPLPTPQQPQPQQQSFPLPPPSWPPTSSSSPWSPSPSSSSSSSSSFSAPTLPSIPSTSPFPMLPHASSDHAPRDRLSLGDDYRGRDAAALPRAAGKQPAAFASLDDALAVTEARLQDAAARLQELKASMMASPPPSPKTPPRPAPGGGGGGGGPVAQPPIVVSDPTTDDTGEQVPVPVPPPRRLGSSLKPVPVGPAMAAATTAPLPASSSQPHSTGGSGGLLSPPGLDPASLPSAPTLSSSSLSSPPAKAPPKPLVLFAPIVDKTTLSLQALSHPQPASSSSSSSASPSSTSSTSTAKRQSAELDALRFCLSILDATPPRAADIAAVQRVHATVSAAAQQTSARAAQLRDAIAAKEREWLQGSVAADEDSEGLFLQATRGWPVWDAASAAAAVVAPTDVYQFDCFISYRVASEALLAQELRLHLMKRGLKVFLDQENLKDGENWQSGFVTGLKSSRVVLLLVSAAALDPRRVARSVSAVDNVLLEWETAMAASKWGFCSVLPIYVGSGTIDVTKYPKERFKLPEDERGTELFCRQSAFTTLSQLAALEKRLLLPRPGRDSVDPRLVTTVAQAVDSFRATFPDAQARKSLLYFKELAEKVFGQEYGDSLASAWFSRECQVEPVFEDLYAKFHLIMALNVHWKVFSISRQVRETGKDTTLLGLIMADIKKKDPESLEFLWGSNQTNISIEKSEITAISSALMQHPTVRSINFSYNQFQEDAAKELVKWIGGLPNLSEVLLRDVSAENDYPLISECFRALANSPVSTLRIWGKDETNNEEEEELVSALTELLSSTKTLKQLKIGWEEDLATLARCLNCNSTLTQLSFSFLRLAKGAKKSSVKSFFPAFAQHPSLKEVVLTAVPYLVKPCLDFMATPGGALTKINIKVESEKLDTGDLVWKALGAAADAVTEIHLCVETPEELEDDNPDPLAMAAFPSAAAAAGALTVLDFSAFNYAQPCRFDEAGEALLAAGLRANKSIQTLDLNSCDMRMSGALKVLEALIGHPALAHLDATGLKLTASAAPFIEAMVRECPSLAFLSLNENKLGNPSVCALAEAVLANPRLQELHLEFVNMDHVGTERLADVIQKTDCFSALNVEGKFPLPNPRTFHRTFSTPTPILKSSRPGNEIGFPGAAALASAARRSRNLRTLQVGFAITRDAAELFFDVMNANPKVAVVMKNLWSSGLDDLTREHLCLVASVNSIEERTAAEEAMHVFDYENRLRVVQANPVIQLNDIPADDDSQKPSPPPPSTADELRNAVLSLAVQIRKTDAELRVLQKAKLDMDSIDRVVKKVQQAELDAAATAAHSKTLTTTTALQKKLSMLRPRKSSDGSAGGGLAAKKSHETIKSKKSAESVAATTVKDKLLAPPTGRADSDPPSPTAAAHGAHAASRPATKSDGKLHHTLTVRHSPRDQKQPDAPAAAAAELGLPEGGGPVNVAFLSTFSRTSSASPYEAAILRQLTLRLDLEEMPAETDADADDDNGEKRREGGAPAKPRKPVVSVATHYKEAYRFIDPHAGAGSLLNGAEFSSVYVILLSDSTIESISQARESMLLVLSIWAYLLKASSRGRLHLLPIFIGSDIDGFHRKLKFALYSLFDRRKTSDVSLLFRGMRTLSKFFRRQGIVYSDGNGNNNGSSKLVIAKIATILDTFHRTSRRRLARLTDGVNLIWSDWIGARGSLADFLLQKEIAPPTPIAEDGAKALAEILPHMRLMTRVRIALAAETSGGRTTDDKRRKDGLPITRDGLGFIFDGLRGNETVHDVYISTSEMYRGERAIAQLAAALSPHFAHWTSLYIKVNFECTSDVVKLGDAIGTSKTLRSLSLVGNSKGRTFLRIKDYLGLRSPGVQALSPGLRANATLEELCIEDNGVDAHGASIVALALKHHPCLTSLSLAGNSIGMDGAKIVIDTLCAPEDSRLTSLNLSGNLLGPSCASLFVPLIQSTRSLERLDLSENDAYDDAVSAILLALADNKTIIEFACKSNQYGMDVAPALEAVILKNKTLASLAVDDNFLNDVTFIGRLLAANSTLTTFTMADNSARDITEFCKLVATNRSLVDLGVGLGDAISRNGYIRPLVELVKAMPNLARLSVLGSSDYFEEIKEAWRSVPGRGDSGLVFGDENNEYSDDDDDSSSRSSSGSSEEDEEEDDSEEESEEDSEEGSDDDDDESGEEEEDGDGFDVNEEEEEDGASAPSSGAAGAPASGGARNVKQQKRKKRRAKASAAAKS
ncbi:hypothetical protein DFJ73DRAFT_963861 [Zopfochytrium polystomum]|nr:hypothetical protein DFJ73DRAFT_963861 [Zopfochytrium polystomum]